MAKAPVCGMNVDERTAKLKSDYMGKTYYFCSQTCKTTFDKDPAKYSGGQSGHSGEFMLRLLLKLDLNRKTSHYLKNLFHFVFFFAFATFLGLLFP